MSGSSFHSDNETGNEETEISIADETAEFDEFGDFDDTFEDNMNDDFGDFGDFEDAEDIPTPVETVDDAAIFTELIMNKPQELTGFITQYLDHIWDNHVSVDMVSSPVEIDEDTTDILKTPCSRELWTQLSRDTVFFNPETGAVGQFQWTRSETNKLYLNALGVTFLTEEASPNKYTPKSTETSNTTADKKRQSTYSDVKSAGISSPSLTDGIHTHSRSASASMSTGGARIVAPKLDDQERESKKEVEQELELDIDIARAYCELTEETIRIFPNVKLNAMVTELTRLQRQAAEYMENLLDQREQLLMDAETYNDLISCIVGHAQRLREQNVNKDASPAMVTKKKKTSGTFSNMIRRKPPNTTVQSASMGGGVIGVKQGSNSKTSNRMTAAESRRSL